MASGDRDGPPPSPTPRAGRSDAAPSAPPSFHSCRVGDDDLKSRAIPALPETAGSFRSWKNSVITMLLSYDLSAEGLLNEWLQKGMRARSTEEVEELKLSSGDFPRFDRMLAAALTRPEHLKSIFGFQLQSYVEGCQTEGHGMRGRILLNTIVREFDPDRTFGSVISEIELFQLGAPDGYSLVALKAWRDKVSYILNQLPSHERPPDRMMSKWLFERLKRVGPLRRYIDQIRDSAEGTRERTFGFLWERLQRTIHEYQQDANAASIQGDIRKGPAKPSTKNVPATPGFKGDSKPENKGKDGGKGKRADGKGSGNKGKDKGKGKSGSKGGKSPDAAGSNRTPDVPKGVCVYHSRGMCRRGADCPFEHKGQHSRCGSSP